MAPSLSINRTKTPAEFAASSKKKFAVAIGRLRRNQTELALLSLQGSLEDALHAYLFPRGKSFAQDDWDSLLEAITTDPSRSISFDEGERIRRINRLCSSIAHGESVTVTQESIEMYKHLVAALLQRYGIAVVIPDDVPTGLLIIPPEPEQEPIALWEWINNMGYRYGIAPIPTIITVCLMIIVGIGLVINVGRSSSVSFNGDGTTTSHPSVVVTASPSVERFAVGQTLYVQDTASHGLALRIRPGNSDDIPIQIYLEPQTAVEIVGGPVYIDGYTWWQVRAAHQQGWCAGEFLATKR